jgi:hypothetical protein
MSGENAAARALLEAAAFPAGAAGYRARFGA